MGRVRLPGDDGWPFPVFAEPMPHPLTDAWINGDVGAVTACFREDGAFHSPVIGGRGWIGRESIGGLMKVVFDVTSDPEFTFDMREGAIQILGFNSKFRGTLVTCVVQLDLDEDELIRDLWVYARPLKGTVAINAAMGPGLSGHIDRRLAVPARVALRPFIWMAAVIDRAGRWVADRMNRA